MKCSASEQKKCPKSHKTTWRCFNGEPKSCHTCEHDRKNAEKKALRAAEERLKQEDDSRKHQEAIAKYDEQIQKLTDDVKRQRLEAERAAIIEQKKQDLANANERAKKATAPAVAPTPAKKAGEAPIVAPKSSRSPKQQAQQPTAPESTPKSRALLRNHIKTCVDNKASSSKTEWQRQKDQLNATNPAIDEIMDMIGLEEVKAQILRIKSKVDVSVRQGTDLRKERLGLVLLGNPGTGLFSHPLFREFVSNNCR